MLSPSIFLIPLRNGIKDKSISFYVNQVNELHSSAAETRFAAVNDLIIFFLIFYFLEKSVLRLRYAIVFTLTFVALKSMTAFENNRRKEAVVYSTKKLPVYEIISGRQTYLYYYSQDSMKARKLSDDMHAFYKLNKSERIEFDLNDRANLVYGKYLVAGTITFPIIDTLIHQRVKYSPKKPSPSASVHVPLTP